MAQHNEIATEQDKIEAVSARLAQRKTMKPKRSAKAYPAIKALAPNIMALRDQGFSWREIAQDFCDEGIQISANALRVLTKQTLKAQLSESPIGERSPQQTLQNPVPVRFRERRTSPGGDSEGSAKAKIASASIRDAAESETTGQRLEEPQPATDAIAKAVAKLQATEGASQSTARRGTFAVIEDTPDI